MRGRKAQEGIHEKSVERKHSTTAPRRVSSLPLPCPVHALVFWLCLNAEMHVSK